MMFSHIFPKLTDDNSRVTSEAAYYNCIAWAAGRNDTWLEPVPGCEWPDGLEREFTPKVVEKLFANLGFETCDGKEHERGFEKIAIYGLEGECTHAARQLPDGKWTSKLGLRHDIEHSCPHDLEGEDYGEILCLMKKPIG